MNEIWKDIPGFDGIYQASTLGRIRNKEKNTVFSLKKVNKRNGYYLRVGLKGRDYYVHYLVSITFPEICGERFEGAEIDHKNRDKADNRPENLHWVTHSRNLKNRSNAIAPYSVEQLKENSVVATYVSVLEASKKTKTNMTAILRCCHSSKADKNGFFWRYAS